MNDSTGFRDPYNLPGLKDLPYRVPGGSVRAVFSETRRGALASLAAKRAYDYASERGLVYYLYEQGAAPSEDDPAERVPPDHFSWIWDIGDLTSTSRLWYESPDRWREETERRGGAGTTYDVADGGQRWIYNPPDRPSYTSDNYASNRKWPPIFGLLVPSLLWDHLDPVLVEDTGRRGEHAGRSTVEIEARMISLDHPPRGLSGVEGADDYVLSLDAETGTAVRYAERFGGEEFYVAEVAEIHFDEAFPDGTFRLDLPGFGNRRVEQ